jgi:3-hydroxyacyl-CoA dehydrogenase/enoyl-CoA hydratase/3-hydroxybutyryl-CoA epimerase
MPLLMEGRPVDVVEALKIGLIDEVVDRTALMGAARRWIASAPEAVQPWDRENHALPGFHPQSPEGRNFFSAAWPALRRKTLVADAAPGAILQVLHHGLERGIDAGLRIEAMHFSAVASSLSAKNKIRTQYYAATAARNLKARSKDGVRPARVGDWRRPDGQRHRLRLARVAVTLVDVSEERLREGPRSTAPQRLKAVERGTLSQAKLDRLMSLIGTATDLPAAGCEAVFEAVVEIESVARCHCPGRGGFAARCADCHQHVDAADFRSAGALQIPAT